MCQSRKTAAAPSSKRTTVDFVNAATKPKSTPAAVPTSAAFIAGRRRQAIAVSTAAAPPTTPASDRPVETARVRTPPARVGHDHERSEADDHGSGTDDLSPSDVLMGEPDPEREREHHARDHERLDDDQLPDAQRGRLGDVPGRVGDEACKPHGPLQQAHEEADLERRRVRLLQRPFLLQHRPDPEQEAAEERQADGEGVHSFTGSYTTTVPAR